MCGESARTGNKKQCCITIDDEAQCFACVCNARQCGCFPFLCCAADKDNHMAAVVFCCVQCDLCWPFEVLFYILTCKCFRKGKGAPAVEITDAMVDPCTTQPKGVEPSVPAEEDAEATREVGSSLEIVRETD
eukprot:CAMPEP_0118973788 /NCGR_PEP_ID=MMETSP1173-20130426/10910_1 /TAXON_ID=1034831 /ORGANISM="Rhizochromulina marina cf, Strain CCMP1243" /LENGTH=131 /DNA_ID=CAMNT_0006923481 /DNA_START=36 /DNA_END=431 /DNA_ORIENTATION=+